MTNHADLERALLSADPEDRRHAISRLSEATPELAVVLLPRALGDDDWRVRKEAVRAAGALAPTPALLGAVLKALEPGENVGLRNAAVEVLSGWGACAVDALTEVVATLDADGRKLAAEAMGRSAQASAVPILKAMANDPDPNVRVGAIESLTALGPVCPDDIVPVLTEHLKASDPFQRLTALDGLNALGAVLTWDLIEPLLAHPVLTRSALLAAGRNRDPRAAQLLASALGQARGSGWEWALAALAEYIRAGEPLVGAARACLRPLESALVGKLTEQSMTAESLELRRQALLVLGAIGSRATTEVVLDAAADDTLLGTVEDALRLSGPEAVTALVQRSVRGDERERAANLELLSRIATADAEEQVVGAIRRALTEGGPELVCAGLRALGVVSDASCLAAAARWLTSEAPVSVRKAAVSAVVSMARRHPAEAAARAREAHPEQQEAFFACLVIQALARPVLGAAEDDQRFLAATLSNSDRVVRRTALEALAALGHANGVDAAVFALADEEPDVRAAAVRALGRMRDAEGLVSGLDRLITLATTSQDEPLVVVTIRALGDTQDPRVLGVLSPIARSGAPVAAVAAVEALGSLNEPGQVDALIDALDHVDEEVVKAALGALRPFRLPRVAGRVGVCVDHPSWSVRRLAADLLGHIGGEMTAALLRAKLSTEEEPLVREAIQRALGGPEIAKIPLRPTPIPPALGSWPPR
jgi:HEAT repeat protein